MEREKLERLGPAIKIGLAILLPVLTYWSTMTLPINDRSLLTTLNNFLWISCGVYFVLYLPIKGLGLRQWVVKVLLVLLVFSMFVTTFNGAIAHRSALIRSGQ
ncbi:MAG TPA: hypothetical protein VK464_17935 [Symbiobacteriaceae bacterium]|jgi:hypothetical protein|nr:hypothetical protein [Symbiobacteriaceae bacterium]